MDVTSKNQFYENSSAFDPSFLFKLSQYEGTDMHILIYSWKALGNLNIGGTTSVSIINSTNE